MSEENKKSPIDLKNFSFNKNKVIFLGILGILLAIIIGIAVTIQTGKTFGVQSKAYGVFKIWMINGDGSSNTEIIDDFKRAHPEYGKQIIEIENFDNYDDYYYALSLAVIGGEAPDVFMLNNGESEPIFASQVIGINNSIVKPSEFRKRYKGVFSDDLIATEGSGKDREDFLVGVPVGYESLGIFFNRRYVKSADITTLSSLNNVVAGIKEKNPHVIPIGIGNGTTVKNSADIITQFFVSNGGSSSLNDLAGNIEQDSFATYFLYGNESGYNGYNTKYLELTNRGKTALDLFSRGDSYMLVGYPSLINDLQTNNYNKNYLLASPFPNFYEGNNNLMINYDYFVINKNTDNLDLSNIFMGYMSSDRGSSKYLDNYTYYFPALLSLKTEKLESLIHEDYNIILNDFYNDDAELISFDRGIRSLYDANIVKILDNFKTYESEFEKLKSSIRCKANKISTLEDLSRSCDE